MAIQPRPTQMISLYSAKLIKKIFKIIILTFIVYMVLQTYKWRVEEINLNKKPNIVYKTMKYILQFSGKDLDPFPSMGEGNSAFIRNNCKFTNCFITADHDFLNGADFDAIVFNGKHVINMKPSQFPEKRSLKQKYIFAATESADLYPVCNEALDGFFNWTWTYRLDSNFRFGYITIYDTEGKKVGPGIDIKWPEKMEPITEDLEKKLSRKSKVAAWFVSHCQTESKRENFVAEVNEALQQYDYKVDIYGNCGELSCPRNIQRECNKLMENNYYFYFAFENSFAEDYVTEKLLTALNNYAVPVVFGGADYSRFLPEGSYLDARKLGAKKLTRVMRELMANKTKYYEFFRWRNHFTYEITTETADICNICEALNDKQMVNSVSMWKKFRQWWNSARYKEHC